MNKEKNFISILALETSCDETAAAVVGYNGQRIQVFSNIVSSQVKVHSRWGGVVPNLAAREHIKNIVPVLEKALLESKTNLSSFDLIAVTQGPGLMPSLVIGIAAAKTLAYLGRKPLLGIHHIEGHIYSNFIEQSQKEKRIIDFPILCLVVSGGHTQLIMMKDHLRYEIIGETLDDAAGEAFDKAARILKLGYPGGPAIAKMASQWKLKIRKYKLANSKIKDQKTIIELPRPMINSNNLDFSFSGLKTAFLYETEKYQKSKLKAEKAKSLKDFAGEMCAEFQQAVIDVLIHKTLKAAKTYRPKTVMLAGGVSANQELRKQLENKIKMELPAISFLMPNELYSIDNAAMIGAAAAFRWEKMSFAQKQKAHNNWMTLEPKADLKLK